MFSESDMTLAVDLSGSHRIDGWLASEKLDGCRAYWDGTQFWTRGGKAVKAPAWFTERLPSIHLDGEIWCGRDGLRKASNAVRLGGRYFERDEIQFAVFDAPQSAGTWLQRMTTARAAIRLAVYAHAVAIQTVRMVWPSQLRTGEITLANYLLAIQKQGGEGAMFRNPDAVGYITGRTENLLRFKLTE